MKRMVEAREWDENNEEKKGAEDRWFERNA